MFATKLRVNLNSLISVKFRSSSSVAVGNEAQIVRTYTEEDVETFAKVSGDWNPIHLSETAARSVGFDGRIVHGALINGSISALIGTVIPGPGSILVRQTLNYKNPLFIGEEVIVKAKIAAVAKNLVTCQYECLAKDKVVVSGEATVLFKRDLLYAS